MYSNIKNYILQHRLATFVVLLLIVILFIPVFFSTSQQDKLSKVQEVPVQQHTVTNIPSSTSSEPTLPAVATTIYSEGTYQLAVPQTWTQDTDTATASDVRGSMTSFVPRASNADENAHVAIEINSTQDTSLASISGGLAFLGFHKSTTTVSGIAAQKFTGAVTFSQKTLHNTIYLFSYNNQIYLIKLSYQGSVYDLPLEKEFTQVVTSLKLY